MSIQKFRKKNIRQKKARTPKDEEIRTITEGRRGQCVPPVSRFQAKAPERHSFPLLLAINRSPSASYAFCNCRNSVLNIPATTRTHSCPVAPQCGAAPPGGSAPPNWRTQPRTFLPAPAAVPQRPLAGNGPCGKHDFSGHSPLRFRPLRPPNQSPAPAHSPVSRLLSPESPNLPPGLAAIVISHARAGPPTAPDRM